MSQEQPNDGTNPAALAAAEEQIVIVAQLDDGSNATLTPAKFRAKSGWQNAPEKAGLKVPQGRSHASPGHRPGIRSRPG